MDLQHWSRWKVALVVLCELAIAGVVLLLFLIAVTP
jgi:hypothetical protein